jgi:hypothetical protein
MQQQFSMSFRLQRQRGTLPSHRSPWLGAFFFISMSALVWLQKHDTVRLQTKPTVIPAAAKITPDQPQSPEEAAVVTHGQSPWPSRQRNPNFV